MSHSMLEGMQCCLDWVSYVKLPSRSAPKWSADRAMRQYPEFTHVNLDKSEPILLTGEMVSLEGFSLSLLL